MFQNISCYRIMFTVYNHSQLLKFKFMFKNKKLTVI